MPLLYFFKNLLLCYIRFIHLFILSCIYQQVFVCQDSAELLKILEAGLLTLLLGPSRALLIGGYAGILGKELWHVLVFSFWGPLELIPSSQGVSYYQKL